ncbi:MAG: prolipoprotein diacylglyceryl transferase [Candidatus Zixiibacteriota bacterium]|nr:MAG: prolipoprotein diacylglyceryl transferase [candidate division Zixibacteria bacterium]
MLPELFEIGPFPIRGYGLMLAISFILGVLYIQRITARDGKPFEPFLSIAYIMIFGGVIGARLFYVILHIPEFAGNWISVVNPFQSDQFGIAGLNLYGGVLLAIAGTLIYCRWKKLSTLEVFDYFAPTLGLGLVFTRIGCFLNGCCFGTPTDLPWAVTFPIGSIPYSVYGDQHLHPAQLYSSLYGLALFLLLHFLAKRKQFAGQVMAVLLMSEATFRFVIEYVRYYENAMLFAVGSWQPTYNQVVSLILFVSGLVLYIVRRKHAANSHEG